MDMANQLGMLGLQWYHIILVIGLIGVLVFYSMYRRQQ